MIAADTSSLIAYFAGKDGSDTDKIHDALREGELRISPVVFAELLSDPKSSRELEPVVSRWRPLTITDGYWLRAAQMRSRLLTLKFKPKLPDTLIAQSTIDHGIALVVRDDDFRPFEKHCGLKLA